MKCTKANSINELEVESQLSDSVCSSEVGNSRTDSSLLSSTENCSGCNNGVAIAVCNDQFKKDIDLECQKKFTKKSRKCGSIWLVINGFILVILGFLSTIWTPYRLLLSERLRMHPGLPAYEWWKTPPDEVLLRFYVFNVTNFEDFLNSNATKLQIEEIGPIIYREKLTHSNVTINETDGTLTYTATRWAVYLPEMNTIDLNATLIVPNVAVLGALSYMSDANFITRFGLDLLSRRLSSMPYQKVTIYDYLWNMTDPLLKTAETIAPFLVPTKNVGILANFYRVPSDVMTVKFGTRHGDKEFFKIQEMAGTEFMFGADSTCKQSIKNATEGIVYNQLLDKNTPVKYWRKSVCRVMDLHYKEELVKYGVNAYKYQVRQDGLNPREDEAGCSALNLPPGMADASKCYFGFPFAATFPHFLGFENISSIMEGFKPNEANHSSYIIVEPKTGIPMEGYARMQSSIIVKDMSSFHDRFKKFSNTIVPLFWAEYVQVGLPWYLQTLVYVTVVVIPNTQFIFSTILMLVGLILVYKGIYVRYVSTKLQMFRSNTLMHFEREIMIKRCS